MSGRAFIRVFCAALLCLTLVGVESAAAVQTNPAEDVYTFGDAPFFGSPGTASLTAPLVGMAPTPTGNGYTSLNGKRIVGISATPTGLGYWMVDPVSFPPPPPPPAVSPPPPPPPPASNCAPGYPGNCFPYPPDLDCGQISQRNFAVTGTDPHGFDADNDGIGCEQN